MAQNQYHVSLWTHIHEELTRKSASNWAQATISSRKPSLDGCGLLGSHTTINKNSRQDDGDPGSLCFPLSLWLLWEWPCPQENFRVFKNGSVLRDLL